MDRIDNGDVATVSDRRQSISNRVERFAKVLSAVCSNKNDSLVTWYAREWLGIPVAGHARNLEQSIDDSISRYEYTTGGNAFS